ncbi:hypothetical protein HK103_001847 [Boothiomyces macroporosus]|uniref:Gamma tubulin complex component protein N-terminal domain-containing protein n=1 Tax=Boothiomyces macroporosus TaxID=261099 RepID=A0AAD5UDQ6_9FUNG|nr:hypothetical protein HK103_001847 [Boothiomyces macroporosus]
MLTVEKLREGTKMLSLLKYLYDLASKPLFTWLECWLTQSSNDQIDTFDPHNEFFISGNKQYGYELKEDLLPSFITLELAREIYSMGITWRQKFLKENEDFKKKELEMQNLQEKEQQNREMEKLENQRLLEHMEIERLNLEYHKKLDNLEKKGMFLDWRTKRVQLSNDRKKILDEPWSEAPLYTFETERKFNYVVQHVEANEIAYPHETTKVVNQNLHTPAPYNGMVSSDCVNLEEQKYSDQEGTNQTLKVTKTQIEDISEKVLEGQSSNSNHESSQLQPDVEMPNESTRIENSFTKDQELINWMLNPCEKNDTIQVVQPNTDIWLKDQFQIVLSISQDFDEMLVSMEESINQTVLFQVPSQYPKAVLLDG